MLRFHFSVIVTTTKRDFSIAMLQQYFSVILAFRETLSGDALGFDLDDTITTLETLRGQFNTAGQTDLETQTNNIIMQLEDIRDNQLPAIDSSAERLEGQVNQLSDHIDTVVVSTVEDLFSILMITTRTHMITAGQSKLQHNMKVLKPITSLC